ncbi:MAG: hypothetical protein ACK5L3_13715 [Oscillospiraceae bacterium]
MLSIKNEISKLTNTELAAANAKFTPFNSKHEGYAVALEEYDEANTAFIEVYKSISELWENIKANADNLTIKEYAGWLREETEKTIGELFQLAAMSQKLVDLCNVLIDEETP